MKKKGHCACVCVCARARVFVCVRKREREHFLRACAQACIAGWQARVSGQAWINKRCVYPICSPATLITTHVL